MTTKIITQISRSPVTFSSYNVSLKWKYDSVPGYTVVSTNSLVYANGLLATPVEITFDETIDTNIQICSTILNSCGTEFCTVYVTTLNHEFAETEFDSTEFN